MRRFLILLFAMCTAAPMTAQTASESNEQLLRALLEEMRILRLTLQKTAAHQVRADVLLERMKLQQAVVRELQQQTEQWNQDRGLMFEHEPYDDVVRDIEERFKSENDPERKKQIERELAGMQRRREMEMRRREQMQVRFQRLEARLTEETAKLRSIEEELARLEAEMTRAAEAQ